MLISMLFNSNPSLWSFDCMGFVKSNWLFRTWITTNLFWSSLSNSQQSSFYHFYFQLNRKANYIGFPIESFLYVSQCMWEIENANCVWNATNRSILLLSVWFVGEGFHVQCRLNRFNPWAWTQLEWPAFYSFQTALKKCIQIPIFFSFLLKRVLWR